MVLNNNGLMNFKDFTNNGENNGISKEQFKFYNQINKERKMIMINLLRVDDRLLHGQVAITWSKYLRLDLILIANSEAVNDEFTIMTLNLAKPRNVQIIIEDLENTIDLLKNNYFDKNIMIVVKNVEDAYKLSQSIFEIKNLNLGGIRERRNSVKITPYVSLTENDFNQLIEMNKYMHVFIQKIPEDVITEFEEVKKCYLSL